MRLRSRVLLGWILLGSAASIAVATAWVRWDIAQRREVFASDARIAHRLLSQQAAALAAVVRTLSAVDGPRSDSALARQAVLHPAIEQVLQRTEGRDWSEVPGLASSKALAEAERQSQALSLPQVAAGAGTDGRYVLVHAAADVGLRPHALVVSIKRLAAWPEGSWPVDARFDVDLQVADVVVPLQRAPVGDWLDRGLTPGFVFDKPLDAPGQTFRLGLRQRTGPADWPWAAIVGSTLVLASGTAGLAAWSSQRAARQRAESRLRMQRIARLNTVGEAAAGLAHELNQPLTGALTNAQAARRLLVEAAMPTMVDDGDTRVPLRGDAWADVQESWRLAGESVDASIAQIRRAADVVRRVRDRLEPGAAPEPQAFALDGVVNATLGVVMDELARLDIRVDADVRPTMALGDPGAVEQVLLNLLSNARDAVSDQRTDRRRIRVHVSGGLGEATLEVTDLGSGIAPEVRDRLFQPFVSTKPNGLGLGLSLCEGLVGQLGGRLVARDGEPVGTVFTLSLPSTAAPT